MKVEFDGQVRDVDTAHISFRQALAIQKQTGLSIGDWEDSLDFKRDDEQKILNPPPEWLISVGALYWLMLAQNGEKADPDTMDFDVYGFLRAYFAAMMAELDRLKAEAEAKPDPTLPLTIPAPPGDRGLSTSAIPTDMTLTPPASLPEGAATGF